MWGPRMFGNRMFGPAAGLVPGPGVVPGMLYAIRNTIIAILRRRRR